MADHLGRRRERVARATAEFCIRKSRDESCGGPLPSALCADGRACCHDPSLLRVFPPARQGSPRVPTPEGGRNGGTSKAGKRTQGAGGPEHQSRAPSTKGGHPHPGAWTSPFRPQWGRSDWEGVGRSGHPLAEAASAGTAKRRVLLRTGRPESMLDTPLHVRTCLHAHGATRVSRVSQTQKKATVSTRTGRPSSVRERPARSRHRLHAHGSTLHTAANQNRPSLQGRRDGRVSPWRVPPDGLPPDG
jgi:hypothetical protein